jgi:hypothetical protein
MLPPPVPKEEINDDQKIKERNVYVVLINKNDQLMVEGEPMHIGELKKKAKEFIENPEEFNNGGSAVMKSNGTEFKEALPYLLLIVAFCVIVIYSCNLSINV